MKPNLSPLVLAVAFSVTASAQSYDISWFSIDGGGGTSSGGSYSVSGTMGQPDAGTLTGGNYSLVGGFWGAVAAVQTPGAPLLTVRREGSNVILSWPATSTIFTLQATGNLATPDWNPVAGSPTVVEGQNQVVITSPLGNSFYRLRYP